MKRIFFRFRIAVTQNPATIGQLGAIRVVSIFCLIVSVCSLIGNSVRAQKPDDANAAFKQTVQQLSQSRLAGTAESEAQQEKASGYLDAIATRYLNGPTAQDLDAVNKELAGLVSEDPPVGENYRLMRLGGDPAVYALVANFGLGGPAAVRIYASTSGHIALVGQIDHFTQKAFYDSDVELVPVASTEPIFVIASGRTDDLATGIFSAWRFDGQHLVQLWNSDWLEQSSYEATQGGFDVTYCAAPDDEHPGQCPKMSRDLYRFEGGEWKHVSTTDLGPSKAPSK